MKTVFPDWAGLTPEKVEQDLPRLLAEAEKSVAAIEAAAPTTYENFVWRLDDATRELWRLWGAVSHLLGVMNSEAWRELEEAWQPKIVAFSLRVSQSKKLYEIARSCLKSLVPGPDVRDLPTRRRILEKMIQGAELAGVGLEGVKKDRFNEIQMALAKLGTDFHNAVIDATKAFSFEKDGKTYTIDDANYPETMKHCADRAVREKLYRARVTRAPENEARIGEILKLRREEAEILGFPDYAARSLVTKCAPSAAAVMKMIDDLDAATAEKAKVERDDLVGAASLPCQTREAVAKPRSARDPRARPVQCCARESRALRSLAKDFATATGEEPKKSDLRLQLTTSTSLQPWDVAYEAERLRERKYAYSEEELKKCFELEDVLKGLFRMTKLLFGVDVEEVADKPSVWHEDVRFFAVREKGEAIAHFYFDPFVRNGLKSGGAWMNEFRNRCASRAARSAECLVQSAKCLVQSAKCLVLSAECGVQGAKCTAARHCAPGTEHQALSTTHQALNTLPLAVVVTNFPVRDEKGKCFLPMREVETLFHEFGHALQCMLTRVDEEDAAGINLVEWDAIEVASQFMENWCLDDRTGIAVPAELKAKVRAAKNFRAATACRRQLAFAKLDLLLHSANHPSDVSNNQTIKQSNNSPNALQSAVFAHFGLPSIPEDRFLCAFTHIFAGGYAAGYYGYKWAEVMSADCYGAFEEAGLGDDAKVRAVGAKYRETVLALGGSKSALDVFRDFRGRDPEISALLRQQDLL